MPTARICKSIPERRPADVKAMGRNRATGAANDGKMTSSREYQCSFDITGARRQEQRTGKNGDVAVVHALIVFIAHEPDMYRPPLSKHHASNLLAF